METGAAKALTAVSANSKSMLDRTDKVYYNIETRWYGSMVAH